MSRATTTPSISTPSISTPSISTPSSSSCSSPSLRVLIADDQDLVRTGLAMILDAQPHITVIAQAVDGRDAVEQAQRLRPDVCLLDIRMPKLDGIEATRLLAGPDVEHPIPVVVVTTFDLDEYVFNALKAGARGFLLKDAGPAMLVAALEAAAAGDALIAPNITGRLLQAFAGSDTAMLTRAARRAPVALSEREREVLLAVAIGQTNAEIAAEKFISLSTVKSHIASLMTKLNARNRVELAIYCYESGLISD